MKTTRENTLTALFVVAFGFLAACNCQAQQNRSRDSRTLDGNRNGKSHAKASVPDDYNPPLPSAHLSQMLGMSAARLMYGGLQINSVDRNSLGEFMGLETGDVIYSAEGREIGSLKDLEDAVKASRGTLMLDLKNVRTGKREVLPSPDGQGQRFRRPRQKHRQRLVQLPALGMSVEIMPNGRDYKVSTVDTWGLGAKLGLQSGDVLRRLNGQPIQQVTNLEKAVRGGFTLTYYSTRLRQELTVSRSDSRLQPNDPIVNPYIDHDRHPWRRRDESSDRPINGDWSGAVTINGQTLELIAGQNEQGDYVIRIRH